MVSRLDSERTYVAVVARDPALRLRLKVALDRMGNEVVTFPDDSALLPELDRLASAERSGGARCRKVLVVDGVAGGRGQQTACWARAYFDKVYLIGSRPAERQAAVWTCRADGFLNGRDRQSLPDRVAALTGSPDRHSLLGRVG